MHSAGLGSAASSAKDQRKLGVSNSRKRAGAGARAELTVCSLTRRPEQSGIMDWKEIDVSCISPHDPQLARLADAIAQRVGQQRFNVWFNNSTRLDLKHDGLEIAVPNDFISEWITTHFKRPIQEAAHEVLGCPLPVRFSAFRQWFE